MADSEPETRERRAEGPGRRLRRAREKRGLSTADAADALHLDRNTVEALDNDAFDRLPPVTFIKGYLRAYARLVDLPEEDVLQAFGAVRQPEAERPLTATVGRRRGGGQWLGALLLCLIIIAGIGGGAWAVWRSGVLQQISLPPVPPGLAGLLGLETPQDGLVEAGSSVPLPPPPPDEPEMSASERPRALAEPPSNFLPDEPSEPEATPQPTALPGTLDASGSTPEAVEAGPGDEQPVGAAEPFIADMPDPEPELPATGTRQVRPDAPDIADTSGGDTAVDLPGQTAAAGDAVPAATVAETADAAAAPPPNLQSLSFSFDGESWMEVTDARGERLLFGLISGADETVRGVPPFTLVIGDAGRVTVRYQGDPVPLEPYTRGRVARLTLGEDQGL